MVRSVSSQRSSLRGMVLSAALSSIVVMVCCTHTAVAILTEKNLIRAAVEQKKMYTWYYEEGLKELYESWIDECKTNFDFENGQGIPFEDCPEICNSSKTKASPLYDTPCTYENLVGVSVCSPEKKPPAPLKDKVSECSTSGPMTITPRLGTDDDGDEESPRFNGTCVPSEYIRKAFDSGIYANMKDAYNQSESTIRELFDSDFGILPIPWVVNDTVAFSDQSCGSITAKPSNYGSFNIHGTADTYSLILDPHNEPPAHHALKFDGGNATILGGQNVGDGPIDFHAMNRVDVWGHFNTGSINFTNVADIVVADTNNSGTVDFTDVHASIYNTTNYGSVNMNGGKYLYVSVGGEQHGKVVAEGDLEGTFVFDKNLGSIEVKSPAKVEATINSNTGTITIDDGVTGSLTVYSNTGSIDTPSSGFTYSLKEWSGTSLTQSLTFEGITADVLDDQALQFIACVIADELGVDCMQVEITSTTTSTSRRLSQSTEATTTKTTTLVVELPVGRDFGEAGKGSRKKVSVAIDSSKSNDANSRRLGQHLQQQRQRRLTDSAVIEYKVSFTTDDDDSTMTSVESTMNTISTDTSSAAATAILEAVEEASGEESLSMSAETASYDDDSTGGGDDDASDDAAAARASFMKYGVPGLGVIVAVIISFLIHHFCIKKRDTTAQKNKKTQEMVDKNLTTANTSVGMT